MGQNSSGWGSGGSSTSGWGGGSGGGNPTGRGGRSGRGPGGRGPMGGRGPGMGIPPRSRGGWGRGRGGSPFGRGFGRRPFPTYAPPVPGTRQYGPRRAFRRGRSGCSCCFGVLTLGLAPLIIAVARLAARRYARTG